MVIVSSGPSEISDWSIWTVELWVSLISVDLRVLERESERSSP